MRTRTRGTQSQQTPQNETESSDDWFDEGEEGFETAEKLSQGRKPRVNRFWLKAGEEAEIVLLDEGKGFFIHEYEIFDSARRKMFYETVRPDSEYDPLQALVGVDGRFKDPYYVMYLTCIDLTPYTDKNGNERTYTKKLIPIKRVQMKKFRRLLEKHGTYRGLVLRMIRDDNKQAKIGDPEWVDPDDFREEGAAEMGQKLLTEDELLDYFGHEAYIGQDGKTVLKEENADCYAYSYKDVLKPSPTEELCRTWNAPMNVGSAQANQQMMNEAPAQEQASNSAAKPPSSRAKGTGGGLSRVKKKTDDAPKEEEAQESKPRRGRKTLAKKPAEQPTDEEAPFDLDENDGAETGDWYNEDDE